MDIIKDLINNNYYKGDNRQIKYIVIHYTTSRSSTKGSAKSSRDWFNNPNAQASAHYCVDDDSIIQCVEDKDSAWHCGTKGTYYCECRNANSIGIEMASNHPDKTSKEIDAQDPRWYFTDKTIINTVELVKYLMHKYGINLDHVIMHYDVTHKWCPAPFLNDKSKWDDFKSMLVESDRYNTLDSVPEWGKEAVAFMISQGYLKGDSVGALNLSYDMLRLLVIIYRITQDRGVLNVLQNRVI